jgi:hypothetical protein
MFLGVMAASIPWERLEHQYSSMNAYRDELRQMVHSEANAFRAGDGACPENNIPRKSLEPPLKIMFQEIV